MRKITVWLVNAASRFMTGYEITRALRAKGLDTDKPFSRWESPQKPLLQGYRGVQLPDRTVGTIKTVIGVVPITEPW